MATGRTIEVVAKLRDSISPTLTKVQTKVKTFGTKVGATFATVKNAVFGLKGALVGVGLILVGGAVKRGIDSLVESSSEFQDAVTALDASIKSMGRTTPNLSSELKRLADEIQVVTGVSNSQIIAGQSFLATYIDIADHLMPRVTKVMVDFAAKTGQGVVPAANAMGKASMGLTGELSRMGITLSDLAKETKDFELILSEIEQQVGGLSDALGTTFTGNVGKVTSAFSDLKRAYGDLLVNSDLVNNLLARTSFFLADLTEKARGFSEEEVEEKFRGWFETLQSVIDGIKGFVLNIQMFFIKVGLGIEGIFNAISRGLRRMAENPLVKSFFGGDTTWLTDLADDLNSIGQESRSFWLEMSEGAVSFAGVLDGASSSVQEVLDGWNQPASTLNKTIEDMGNNLKTVEETAKSTGELRFGFQGTESAVGALGMGMPSVLTGSSDVGKGIFKDDNPLGLFQGNGNKLKEAQVSAGQQAALMFSTAFGDSLAQLMLDGDGASTMEFIGAGIGNILGAEVTESLTESMGGIGAGVVGGLVSGLIGRLFRKNRTKEIDKPIPVKVVNWGDMTGQLLKAGARRNVSPMITTGGNIMMSSNFGREARI
tara:strand:- start:7304 stop:9100 length:1797 start_codon:yes stop_codon:yes gene_type:complete